eukprot:CAMPEP_0115545490 /NCGR_PEP_ID=MMETSP0271-20121206/92633_1 /TAXON_ID=71861 /ORGANISM="Scrippsiella trochoidea, Strain CCMP3099" /LENGTH=266 /DNA_ID=CAMNT_0002978843 /DNA_START=155 /DNA_END=953 /DNA_ORIENTATION=+
MPRRKPPASERRLLHRRSEGVGLALAQRPTWTKCACACACGQATITNTAFTSSLLVVLLLLLLALLLCRDERCNRRRQSKLVASSTADDGRVAELYVGVLLADELRAMEDRHLDHPDRALIAVRNATLLENFVDDRIQPSSLDFAPHRTLCPALNPAHERESSLGDTSASLRNSEMSLADARERESAEPAVTKVWLAAASPNGATVALDEAGTSSVTPVGVTEDGVRGAEAVDESSAEPPAPPKTAVKMPESEAPVPRGASAAVGL